jgi:hypothetical protein
MVSHQPELQKLSCVLEYLLRPFLEIRFCCKTGATKFVSAEEEALIVEKLLFANL